MKKISGTITFLFFFLTAFSQKAAEEIIKMRAYYTTSIILAEEVSEVIIGTVDVQIHSVIRNNHIILLLKNPDDLAAKPADFITTNIIILTKSKKSYTFSIVYDTLKNPDKYNYRYYLIDNFLYRDLAKSPVKKVEKPSPTSVSKKLSISSKALSVAQNLYRSYVSGKGVKELDGFLVKENQITFTLNAIYNYKDTLYLCLGLKNKNTISYKIGHIKIFKTIYNDAAKRLDEEEIPILHIENMAKKIESKESSTFVLVIPKIPLAESEGVVIRIMEEDGERHIIFPIEEEYIFTEPLMYKFPKTKKKKR